MTATLLEVPAGPVPVTAQIGPVLRNHHQVPLPRLHEPFTTGTDITLPGRVRLHRSDDLRLEST